MGVLGSCLTKTGGYKGRTLVQAALDQETFATTWAEGQAMTLEQAINHSQTKGMAAMTIKYNPPKNHGVALIANYPSQTYKPHLLLAAMRRALVE